MSCMEKGSKATKNNKGWIEIKFIKRPERGQVSGWLSTTFVVPKKGNDWRGVVDLRGPNSQTERVSYLLPVIEEFLLSKERTKFFLF